jgi:ElaB/YqjD/DUF883 family membrane-anchored ribosome-binding protein
MQVFLNNIVSSYETSVRNMGAILDTNHNILEGFQDSFLDRKQEWEKLNAELRKILAKNESLRCKDFDNMMQAIFSPQYEEEREVRNLISSCLNEQKEAVNTLRDNFIRVKDAIVTGETERVKEFQGMLKDIFARQDERKREVTLKLKDFQRNQQEIKERLEELRTKGRELRIKDLKSMLKKFNIQHRERIAQQIERRDEVHNILDKFRKERSKKEE